MPTDYTTWMRLNRDLSRPSRAAAGSVQVVDWRLSDAMRFCECNPEMLDILADWLAMLREDLRDGN